MTLSHTCRRQTNLYKEDNNIAKLNSESRRRSTLSTASYSCNIIMAPLGVTSLLVNYLALAAIVCSGQPPPPATRPALSESFSAEVGLVHNGRLSYESG